MEVVISKDIETLLERLEADPQENQYGKYAFRRKDIQTHLSAIGKTWSTINHLVQDKSLVGRPSQGWYDMSTMIDRYKDHINSVRVERIKEEDDRVAKAIEEAGPVADLEEKQTEYVPSVDPTYVSWGNTDDILTIVSSAKWFPAYVVGETGNGKTVMIEQACAQAGREMFRVQIHEETDQDDMIGGFRLDDGSTVFEDGPVIMAMKRGALLLLDEIDRGSNKLMCLQGILEGKPYLIKKTGEVVEPQPGFNVIACANTRGKGDTEGRYSGATVLDEAFLERFYITIVQEYPTMAVERRILRNNMLKHGCLDEEFLEHIIRWSDQIRQTYLNDGSEDLITTRRLCQIVSTFAVFGDRLRAIEYGVNRFDEDTREGFMTTYHAIDPLKYMREEQEQLSEDKKKAA